MKTIVHVPFLCTTTILLVEFLFSTKYYTLFQHCLRNDYCCIYACLRLRPTVVKRYHNNMMYLYRDTYSCICTMWNVYIIWTNRLQWRVYNRERANVSIPPRVLITRIIDIRVKYVCIQLPLDVARCTPYICNCAERTFKRI